MSEENKIEPTVKGVDLPSQVARQLRLQGRPLSSYTHGELTEAVQACKVDGTLIDDPNGTNFFDKLKLTESERREAECKKHGDNCDEHEVHGEFTGRIGRKKKTDSYRELVEESRNNGGVANGKEYH